MRIEIYTMDELLSFIERKEVTPQDAINVFQNALNVVCITFVDAITGEVDLDKENVINKIKEYLDAIKEGKDCKLSVILFN